jgi:aspartyl-tRNA(Asn)/glutamyl-tRNA(Gln) amidotransferase subunit A
VARLAPSLDTVGVLAHQVTDVCAVDCVLHDSAGAHLPDMHFVLVENFCGADVQDEVRHNVCATMSRLSDAGLHCERLRSEPFDRVTEAFRRYGTLVAAEAAHELEPWLHDDTASLLDPFVLHRLREARSMPAHALVALLQLRATLLSELAEAPAGRVYVFPTVPHTAPAASKMDSLAARMAANRDALRHTMPGSFLDMPGIALPNGHDEAGLPTSVLLSCSRGNDALLLAVAMQLESRRIV